MAEVFQYKAFLSYSHKDKKAGEWLHKQLEKYRIPKNLLGDSTDGTSPARTIGRIFRDRDELPAAEDLTEAVRGALETSEYMVVLCSPNSAASRWVNKEIIEFKRLRGDRYVLPIIIDGEPFASDNGMPELECFPPAVRFKIAKTGGLSTLPAEPAAADARKDADGKPRAVLKILAGLLGVGLDQLIEREMRRRQKRVTIITAGAVAAMLVMATLTYEAMNARAAADRSRAEAEDLVEFMLTDLREKLEPVGRLDVLDAVGEKVLSYHDNQETYEDASDDDIGRRARAYHLLAEMEYRRGNMDAAQTMFEQANEATGELLKRDPSNTQRIFEHSQSVFWVGNQAFERGEFQETEIAFRKYKEMAELLVNQDPANTDWQTEAAYANNNLGDLYIRGFNAPRKAIPYLMEANSQFLAIVDAKPNDTYIKKWIAMEYAAIADAYRLFGDIDVVIKYKTLEKEVLDALYISNNSDTSVKERLLYWFITDGWIQSTLNNVDVSEHAYSQAEAIAKALLSVEPESGIWQEDIAFIKYYRVSLSLRNGDLDQASEFYQSARELASHLIDQKSLKNRHRVDLKFLDKLMSLSLGSAKRGLLDIAADLDAAIADLELYVTELEKTQRGRWVYTSLYNLKILALLEQGRSADAKMLFSKVFTQVDGKNHDQIPALLLNLSTMAEVVDDVIIESEIRQTLIGRGYLDAQDHSERTDQIFH